MDRNITARVSIQNSKGRLEYAIQSGPRIYETVTYYYLEVLSYVDPDAQGKKLKTMNFDDFHTMMEVFYRTCAEILANEVIKGVGEICRDT